MMARGRQEHELERINLALVTEKKKLKTLLLAASVTRAELRNAKRRNHAMWQLVQAQQAKMRPLRARRDELMPRVLMRNPAFKSVVQRSPLFMRRFKAQANGQAPP